MGITREEIEELIKKGMKWKDKERSNVWYARRYGYEAVFEELDDVLYVITIYREKGAQK